MRGIIKIIGVIGMSVCICVTPLSVLAESGEESHMNIPVIEETVMGDVEWEKSETTGASVSGNWIKSDSGKWWYKHSDGSYTTNDWEKINGKWYLFDSEGWMLTGWQKRNGSWFYLGDSNDGSMKSGWQKINGHWYYLGDQSDGSMKTGWQKILGLWYFFVDSGEMNTAPLSQGNRSYVFHSSSGHLIKSFINIQRERQEQNSWCWAASSVMIGKYRTNSSISQSQVVQHVKGKIVNKGGTDDEVIKAIKYVSYGSKKSRSVNPQSYDYVKDYIDQNKLFGIHMSWNSGNGHMIVGAGYCLDGNSVYCIDPWESTRNQCYSYPKLVSGTTIQTGTGRCTSLIVY